jgi:hypothetical protein
MDSQPLAVQPAGPVPTRFGHAALLRLAGWSALLGVLAVIASSITISLFFAIGGPWGTVNDVISVVLALSFLPPIAAFRELERKAGIGAAAGVIASIGAVGALGAAAISALVAFGLVAFEATSGLALLTFGLIGVWLVLVSFVQNGDLVGRVASAAGIAAGLGYIAAVGASWVAGSDSSAVVAVGGVAVIGQIVWGLGLGRRFTRGEGR